MRKFIVITTINEPTEAILRYCDLKDWEIIVVGDLKTPHSKYRKLSSNLRYLGPEDQAELYPKLSRALGWNTSCRRDIGFVEAYRSGADILALTDDDNIPLDNWGKEIFIGKSVEVDFYELEGSIPFNPFAPTNYSRLWHRGYPLELSNKPMKAKKSRRAIVPLVQSNFWNGNPDVDAIERILFDSPSCEFDSSCFPFSSSSISPFNSQNTFLDRTAIPYYMLLPGIGRVDDIWGAYLMQMTLAEKRPFVVYAEATVVQDRNEHDLYIDMEQELFGSRNVMRFLRGEKVLPQVSLDAYSAYRETFNCQA